MLNPLQHHYSGIDKLFGHAIIYGMSRLQQSSWGWPYIQSLLQARAFNTWNSEEKKELWPSRHMLNICEKLI